MHMHMDARLKVVGVSVLVCQRDAVVGNIRTCSYKRAKGRSHTVEESKAIHPQKPHATSALAVVPVVKGAAPAHELGCTHGGHLVDQLPVIVGIELASRGQAKARTHAITASRARWHACDDRELPCVYTIKYFVTPHAQS